MGRPRGGGLAAALKRKKKGSKKHKGERKRKKAVLREDSESEEDEQQTEQQPDENHAAAILEEFRNTEGHTAKLLARLHTLEIILANKKSKSAVSLDGVSDPKLIRNLQTDGLKHLVEQRLERASNYYTVITLMVFGCLFFGTACMQMNAATAFAVEDPVLRAHLGDLDAEAFTVNMPDDILEWVDSTLVGGAFEDAQCGNGQCESPQEYPGFGRFGCEDDCGKYKKTSRIMVDFGTIDRASAALGWDWSKVPKREKPIFTYNIWSETMGDWLFEQALVANGTKVMVDVPDGDFKIHLFQQTKMSPFITDSMVAEKLRLSPADYPTRDPAITDYHFGDVGEMVASAAVLMAQLDEYCWGGNMDWSGAGDTSKLDFSCMLEPETHKLLKVLSSYGVEGTVTMSEKGKKAPTVLAKLDLCSLVPEAGTGLTAQANKEMLQAAAVPCPPSSSRRSGLAAHAGSSSVGARLYCRPESAAHTPDGDAAVCSAEAGAGGRAVSMRAAAGTVGQYQPCAAHVECVQSVTDARITSMTGMFCHKGGFCDTCPFCQDDKADAIDGTCPTAFCPLSGGLPECINGSMLASYVNANVTNGTICRSTASFSVWNFHGKGAAVAVTPAVDPSPPGRLLTPFNTLVGPILIDQTRFASAPCKDNGNKYLTNFSAAFPCLATGSLTVGDDASSENADMTYSEGAEDDTGVVLSDEPYGLDPVFLPTSELYDGSVMPQRYYTPSERLSVPLDYADPAGPSRLHIPIGFFPHGHGARGNGTGHVVANRDKHFLAFIDPSCSASQAHSMVKYLVDGGFLDENTKEVSVETVLLNAEHRFLVLVQLLFTWQVGGSIEWDYTIRPMPLELYENSQQFSLEVMVLIFTICYVLAEINQIQHCVRANTLDKYFAGLGNMLDITHLAFLLYTAVLWRNLVEAHKVHVYMPNATAVLADPSSAARFFEVDGERVVTWLNFVENVTEVADQRRVYSAVVSSTCLLFVFRLIKDLDFQPKMSMVSRTLTLSGYDQLHFLCLTAIIWMSFCWASVITFGHQFEALSTVAGASQMWFDAMLTMDTSVFYDQMSHAAHSQWVFQLFFWSWFVIIAVMLINIFLCIFVDAYCIIVEDARNATPMWTELYDVLKHDVCTLILPKTRFMSDQRLLEALEEFHQQECPPAGYAELRKLVMQQLDFHKERSIPTGDAHVTVSPYDLLALVRGLDEAHDPEELRKEVSALAMERSLAGISEEDTTEQGAQGAQTSEPAVNFVQSSSVKNLLLGPAKGASTYEDLGRLILMNHISEKDVATELVDQAFADIFANEDEHKMLEDLMVRYGQTSVETEQADASEVIDVISAEVQRNKILLCHAYLDMSSMMSRISCLSSALHKYSTATDSYTQRLSSTTKADAEAGAKKKSVAQLMSQKRAAKALKFAQGPSKDRLGDILQLTIVEAVNLPMLDRWTMVDSSCIVTLTDEDGTPISQARFCTDVVFDSQEPRWMAQFVVPIRKATHLTIQILNNNSMLHGRIQAVARKRAPPTNSEDKIKLRSSSSNLGIVTVCIDELEHWKEIDEWFPVVNHASAHDGKAKLRVQCSRVPQEVAVARNLAALRVGFGGTDSGKESTKQGDVRDGAAADGSEGVTTSVAPVGRSSRMKARNVAEEAEEAEEVPQQERENNLPAAIGLNGLPDSQQPALQEQDQV